MTVDFQLDDLFNVEAVMTLPDGKEVVVRVLTEPEVQEREDSALRAYEREDKKLSDKEGDEYKRVLAPLDDATVDVLISLITAVDATRYSVRVARDYPLRFFPYPDDATTEEKIAIMRQEDEHEAMVREKRRKAVEEHMLKFRENLSLKTEGELRTMATNAIISASADTARQNEFQVQTVYLASRRGDSKGAPFWTLDEVRNHGKGGLSERIYNEVLSLYAQLDSTDPWTLQKKR